MVVIGSAYVSICAYVAGVRDRCKATLPGADATTTRESARRAI
jgi:hypothetical protein